jgi:prophage antirepressor-like protein
LTSSPRGSNILATVTADNKCYFSPRHVCDALGITWQGQHVKIMADQVLSAAVTIIVTPSTGGNQKTLMLPIEFLSGWLFT